MIGYDRVAPTIEVALVAAVVVHGAVLLPDGIVVPTGTKQTMSGLVGAAVPALKPVPVIVKSSPLPGLAAARVPLLNAAGLTPAIVGEALATGPVLT